MNKQKLNKILKLHKMWLNEEVGGQKANLSRADLRWANLYEANLSGSNLRGADFDFSVFPLWCGSFNIKNSDRIVKQLLGHIARVHVNDKTLEKWIKTIPKKYKNDLCKRHDIKEVK